MTCGVPLRVCSLFCDQYPVFLFPSVALWALCSSHFPAQPRVDVISYIYTVYAGRQAATISVFTERTRRIDIYHAQCSPTSAHHRSHRQGTVPYGGPGRKCESSTSVHTPRSQARPHHLCYIPACVYAAALASPVCASSPAIGSPSRKVGKGRGVAMRLLFCSTLASLRRTMDPVAPAAQR